VKTIISLDDALLQADETARLMGLTRSRLFAVALEEFLEHQRKERMLRRLNIVYASSANVPADHLLQGIKSKVRRTLTERW
jgi:antitoxin MazE6